MRCVVTGAAGFVGSSIVDRLIADGHSVRAIDSFVDYYPRAIKERNLARALNSTQFDFIEGDLLRTDLSALLKGAEWVFHQAAQAGVRASWGQYFESYTDNNVLATQQLLEAIRGTPSVQRVVYASSSSVYGNAESYPTSETLMPQPVSPYGVTKLAAEHLMSLYGSEFGLPTVSLRYFTVYGPRQRPDMAFNRFIQAGLAGSELVVYGDGLQVRDFTYIDDIVQANILAAQKSTSGGVYNVGGGTQATVNDVLAIIEHELGPLRIRREDRQVGDARRTCADTKRVQQDLGFSPSVPLAEGLQRQIAWMRGQV